MSSRNGMTARSSPLGILAGFPREIRNVVYEKIFLPSYQVDFRDWGGTADRTDDTLNILQASSVIYEEAQAVLYKHSTIVFSYKEYVDSEQLPIPPIELWKTGFRRVEIRMDDCMDPKGEVEEKHKRIMARFCDMFMNQLAW